jgi:hypothetical protein
MLIANNPALNMELPQPHIRFIHLIENALRKGNLKKRLTKLLRQFIHLPGPNTMADFLNETTWPLEPFSKDCKHILL